MPDPKQRTQRELQLAQLSGALDDRPVNPSDSRYFASHEFDAHVVMAFPSGRQWSDVNAALRSKL